MANEKESMEKLDEFIKPLITDYSLATKDYRSSKDYLESVKVMEKSGLKQPYVDNILINAFAAGWNARRKKS